MNRKRWTRRLIAAIALSLLSTTLWLVAQREWRRTTGTRELNAAISEADASDPDWSWERLSATRPRPPAGRNGAEVISQVRVLVPQEWTRFNDPERWEPDAPNVLPNVRYSARVIAEARRNLTRAAAAVDTARTLKDCPTGHRDLQLAPDVLSTLLPDLPHTRTAAALLRWDAVLASEDGDHSRAVDDVVAALNASRSIGDEPLLISQVIRIAARAIAAQSLERTVAQAELTEEQLLRLQTAWAADADEPLLLQGLRGDRAAYDTLFRNLADGTLTPDALSGLWGSGVSFESYAWWLWRVRLHSERAYYVRWTTQAVEAARRPPHEQGPLLAALTLPEGSDMKLAPLFLPAAGKVAGAWHRSMAEARCAVVGIACERFRQQHKRWPDTLLELGPAFLPAVPLDPYSAEPLRYRKLDDGVVIHSIGVVPPPTYGLKPTPHLGLPDGIEIGFRLWNPDQRRQPSPPDAEEP